MASKVSPWANVRLQDQIANPDLAAGFSGSYPTSIVDPNMAKYYNVGLADAAPFPMGSPPPPAAPAPAPVPPGGTAPTGGFAGLGVPKAAPAAPMSPEMRALMDQVKAGGEDYLTQQSQGLAGMKDRLSALQQKEMPLDISSLAALTDQWSGSHLAQSYKPPETLQERQAAISKLQDGLVQGQTGLSKDQLDIAQNRLAQFQGLEQKDYTRGQDSIKNQLEQEKINIARQAEIDKRAKESRELQDKLKNPMNDKDSLAARIQFTKLDEAKIARGTTGMIGALNDYEKAFHENSINPTGDSVSKLNTAYTDFVIKFKTAAGLGALSGPDMGIIKDEIQNAGGFDTWLKSKFKGGADGIQSSIDQIRDGSDRDFQNSYEALKSTAGGNSAVSPILDEIQNGYNKAVGARVLAKDKEGHTGMSTVTAPPPVLNSYEAKLAHYQQLKAAAGE